MWHYPKQREKYRFLLEQNPCTCGAGQSVTMVVLFQEMRSDCCLFSDISFLCETTTAALAQDQPSKLPAQQRTTDKSAIRAPQKESKQEPVRSIFIKYRSDLIKLKFRI